MKTIYTGKFTAVMVNGNKISGKGKIGYNEDNQLIAVRTDVNSYTVRGIDNNSYDIPIASYEKVS